MYKVEEVYDMADVFHVGASFQQEVASLRDKPDLMHTQIMFTKFYELGIGTMLAVKVDDVYVGLLAAVLAPDIFSGVVAAQEVLWYVKPEHRGCGMLLFNAFEQWAKDKDAKYVAVCHMVDSMPEKVGSLYRRMGYTKQDIIYRKEL